MAALFLYSLISQGKHECRVSVVRRKANLFSFKLHQDNLSAQWEELRDQRKENDIDIGIVVGPLPDLTMKGHWWQLKVLVKPKTQLKIPPLVPRSKLVTDAQGKLTVKSEMPWKQILLFSKWETHLTKPVQNPARPLMLRGAAARGALTFFRLTREDAGIA